MWFLQELITAGKIRGGGEGGGGEVKFTRFEKREGTIKVEEVQTRGETDQNFGYFVIK